MANGTASGKFTARVPRVLRQHISIARCAPLLFALVAAVELPGCGDSSLKPAASPAATRAATEAANLGIQRERSISIGSVPMVLEFIPSGEFSMGTAASKRGEDEAPHRVSFEHGFYLSKTEVTQAQYAALIDTNPSSFMGADMPVENVTWDNADEYCKKASALLHETVRLPTEAEWEYACRAGTTTEYWTGDDEASLAKAAWYTANCQERPHAAGLLAANAWGLCDMSGNVWEYCVDGRVVTAPDEKSPGKMKSTDCRMIRGGSWMDQSLDQRAASRTIVPRTFMNPNVGFRVVVELKK